MTGPRRPRTAILSFTSAWVLAWAGVSAPAEEPAREVPFRTVPIGIGEDYASNRRTVEAARRDLEACRRAGATVLRISFSWSEMEPEPGRFDFSFWDEVVPLAVDEYGLRLIPYVCYTPAWASADPASETIWTTPPKDPAAFGRFVGALVTRYKDRLHSWELWNEPDIPEFWTGTPAQFAALIREGSRAVRQADPKARVVLGGIAKHPEYLSTLLRDETISHLVDVVNCHAYFETWHEAPLEELTTYINRMADVIAEYGDGQDLWMAEVGYSNFRPEGSGRISEMYRARHGFEHTPEFQAEALVRSMALILATGKVGLITWYRINDLPGSQTVIGDVNNRSLGLVDLQGRPKPALEGFRRGTALFGRPLRAADDRVQVTRPIASRAEVHCFEGPDGSMTVVAWQRTSVAGDGRRGAAGQEPARAAELLTLTVPGRRLRLAADGPGLGPPGGVLEAILRDGGTSVRLSVTQDRTLSFRLVP
jgi:hypothetical protein